MLDFTKKYLFFQIIFAAFLLFQSCQNTDQTSQTVLENELLKQDNMPFSARTQFYRLDTLKSFVKFNTLADQSNAAQSGQLEFMAGLLAVESSNLVAGKMLINMASLQILTSGKTVEEQKKLLKKAFSKNFMNAEANRLARLEVSGVSPIPLNQTDTLDHQRRWVIARPSHTISANLQVLDSTRLINFPATLQISDSVVILEAKIELDVHLWGIKPVALAKSKSISKDTSSPPPIHYPKLNLHIYIQTKTHKP